MSTSTGIVLAERGLVPISGLRLGIRRLLAQRLREAAGMDPAVFARELAESHVALETDRANEQHYEVPPSFFQLALGPHLKYSSAYWPEGTEELGDAELSMLELSCERAGLQDGQDILELGCGWGSLTLHMARKYPNSRITAVSNSSLQGRFIRDRSPDNVRIHTADMNDFTLESQFDRVVSVEMFEHMRNYDRLLKRIAGWLRPDGRLFVHVFCHREFAYPFEEEGPDNWMGRHFFTGGIMPSFDLLPQFNRDLEIEERWEVNGTHYSKTARSWRENIERHRADVIEVFRGTYGADARRWYHRWRIFFLACEELFGYRGGHEWMVGHYRFAPGVTS